MLSLEEWQKCMKFDILMGVIKTVNFTSLKIHSREFIPLPTAFGNWKIQLKATIVQEYNTGEAIGKKICPLVEVCISMKYLRSLQHAFSKAFDVLP